MKQITVKRIIENDSEQDKRWVKKAPSKEDAEIYEGKESATIRREDGSILAVIVRNAFSKEDTKKYFSTIIKGKAIQTTNNRGNSSGQDRINQVLRDGTISKTNRTAESVQSSIIGFYDRYPRINYCRKTAWTLENAGLWTNVVDYVEKVDSVYKKHCTEKYNEQRKIVNATSPDFLIGNSSYTTITLNRNFRTHYHRDAGNLHEGLAAMNYMKQGRFSGGHIVFPNYGIGVALRNFDLIIFDNIEIHGNTPIVSVKGEDYSRVTSVFFYRKNMIYCGTAEQELERAKRNKGDQIIGPTTEDLNNGQFCRTD